MEQLRIRTCDRILEILYDPAQEDKVAEILNVLRLFERGIIAKIMQLINGK